MADNHFEKEWDVSKVKDMKNMFNEAELFPVGKEMPIKDIRDFDKHEIPKFSFSSRHSRPRDPMFEKITSINLVLNHNSTVSVIPDRRDDGNWDVYVQKRPSMDSWGKHIDCGVIRNVKSPVDVLEGMKDIANARENKEYRDELWDAVSKVSAELNFVKNPTDYKIVDRRFDAFQEQVKVMNDVMKKNGLDVRFGASRTSENNVFTMLVSEGDSKHWVDNIRTGQDAIKNLNQAIEAIPNEKVKEDIQKAQSILAKDIKVMTTIDILRSAVQKYEHEIEAMKKDPNRSLMVMKKVGKERGSLLRNVRVETGKDIDKGR